MMTMWLENAGVVASVVIAIGSVVSVLGVWARSFVKAEFDKLHAKAGPGVAWASGAMIRGGVIYPSIAA